MDEIKGIMQKISLKDEARVNTYLDKSLLFEVVPPEQEDLTEILIDYLVKLEIIIQHAVEAASPTVVPTFYYFDSPEDIEIYIFIANQSLENWNSVLQSTEMQDYLAAKNIFFEQFGWVDHGYRIITVIPDSAVIDISSSVLEINGKAGAEIIWNSVS